ncbi:MAG: HAD-IIIA family hydrolase [Candidatus Methanomethylophilaceae archaeon]
MSNLITSCIKDSARAVEGIDPEQVQRIADALTQVFRAGRKLVVMGNGGSAADAQHLATEFTGRFLFERPPLPAICLSNISPVTAIGNDYSFNEVFSRQVRAYVQPGDAVLGISTSGGSANILEAIRVAKEAGALTISFSGCRGSLKDISDIALTVPSERTPHIQEAYMVAGHLVCGMVESAVFGRKTVFIDRDDTIAKDCPYCARPEDLELYPDVPSSIARLNQAGYLVLLVTNQSGVSRGYFSHEMLARIHERMLSSIAAEGGRIDDIFYCPHHPDEGCDCRKPEVGMVRQAMAKYNIDLSRSYVVGDSDKDVEMGRRCGMRTYQVTKGFSFQDAVDAILEADG